MAVDDAITRDKDRYEAVPVKNRWPSIGHALANFYKRHFPQNAHNIRSWIARKVKWAELKTRWGDAAKAASRDASLWLTEAIIEGFIANFALHQIFSLPMTWLTIPAYGFLIKEGIDVFNRMFPRAVNGSDNKIRRDGQSK